MSAELGVDFMNALAEVVPIPLNAVSVTIHAAVDGIAMITVTHHLDSEATEKVVELVKTYQLQEMEGGPRKKLQREDMEPFLKKSVNHRGHRGHGDQVNHCEAAG